MLYKNRKDDNKNQKDNVLTSDDSNNELACNLVPRWVHQYIGDGGATHREEGPGQEVSLGDDHCLAGVISGRGLLPGSCGAGHAKLNLFYEVAGAGC